MGQGLQQQSNPRLTEQGLTEQGLTGRRNTLNGLRLSLLATVQTGGRRVGYWAAIFLFLVGIMSLTPAAAIAAAPTTASDSIARIGAVAPAVSASTTADGAEIFEANCAGCHLKGGNIIRRGKTLKLKALHRNQVDSLDAIMALVSQGKGNMSAYGDRLSPEAIEAVSQYVLDQANAGWR